jgi:glycosyltransferase involved in cell wall biosynthesis
LAHLLPDCVNSILAQTYRDLEVLIMDDCSPDNTSEVARSFRDRRVSHIRNEVNLGHLANYNRGIELARGTYVWLISADDQLRRSYVLHRYIQLLDARPEVGFVFCPAMRFQDGSDISVYGACGDRDTVWRGHDFLRSHLLGGNIVPSPSGLARRECYERVGRFPLDLPFAGDWYMWAVFALAWDVGYFREPMVGYRDHELNMTKTFKKQARLLVADELEVLWRLFDLVKSIGRPNLADATQRAIADQYAYRAVSRARDADAIGLSVEEFEGDLARRGASRKVIAGILARIYAALGDQHHDAGDLPSARACYARSLSHDPSELRTVAKYALLHLGKPGDWIRARLGARRNRGRSSTSS